MPVRCQGKSRLGSQCRLDAVGGGAYCRHHRQQGVSGLAFASGLGALVGNFLVPGAGGAVGGALLGGLAKLLSEPGRPKNPRVFVSFDFDNDQQLKHLLVGQTKRSDLPFSVIDGSLQEAAPEPRWKEAARKEIQHCDLVVVLVGRQTYRARGVLAEVAMAREEGKTIVQLVSATHRGCPRVPNAGRRLAWTHDNMTKLFGP